MTLRVTSSTGQTVVIHQGDSVSRAYDSLLRSILIDTIRDPEEKVSLTLEGPNGEKAALPSFPVEMTRTVRACGNRWHPAEFLEVSARLHHFCPSDGRMYFAEGIESASSGQVKLQIRLESLAGVAIALDSVRYARRILASAIASLVVWIASFFAVLLLPLTWQGRLTAAGTILGLTLARGAYLYIKKARGGTMSPKNLPGWQFYSIVLLHYTIAAALFLLPPLGGFIWGVALFFTMTGSVLLSGNASIAYASFVNRTKTPDVAMGRTILAAAYGWHSIQSHSHRGFTGKNAGVSAIVFAGESARLATSLASRGDNLVALDKLGADIEATFRNKAGLLRLDPTPRVLKQTRTFLSGAMRRMAKGRWEELPGDSAQYPLPKPESRRRLIAIFLIKLLPALLIAFLPLLAPTWINSPTATSFVLAAFIAVAALVDLLSRSSAGSNAFATFESAVALTEPPSGRRSG